MSKARLVITALLTEGQTVSEVAARYAVHRSWVYRLKARYDEEGEAAFEPRSRRPLTSPSAIPDTTVELVLQLRKELTDAGLDAGADTHRLAPAPPPPGVVSRATIHRILVGHATVTPDPAKRPKSSYIRFEADLPNETWQSDFTHYRLTHTDGSPGTDVEIITWLDDHSRYALHVTAHPRITGSIVLATFTAAAAEHGYPASTLTDNGMVYTVRFAGGRGGRTSLEVELRRLGITQKNSRPNHPTTCGKVERFQQTLKKWLRAQPRQPATIAELQALLDTFIAAVQPPPPAPLAARTGPPQRPPTPHDPKPRPGTTAAATPTTASAPTRSPRPATSPCATTAACTTSASAEPTPEPTSGSWSKTSTSPSSTPPPARSCANSPSTPAATTNPPDAHTRDPKNE